MVAAAYYGIATRSLLTTGTNFWGNDDGLAILRGLAVWLVPMLILAAIWTACWGRSKRPTRAICALILTTAPPIGMIGWASPLSAAGVLFPGLGWIGVVLTFGLIAAAPESKKFIGAVILLIAAGANLVATPTALPVNWLMVQTAYGDTNYANAEYDRLQAIEKVLKRTIKNAPAGSVIVLPETLISGSWRVADDYLEDVATLAERRGVTVLLGALDQAVGGEVTNGMFQPGKSTPTASSRIAVPLGLWRPWSKISTRLNWFGDGIETIAGQRVAFFICHEQLINWPFLVSLAGKPTAILAPANIWFAEGSSLEGIQRQNTSSWARLFSIPAGFAVNRKDVQRAGR